MPVFTFKPHRNYALARKGEENLVTIFRQLPVTGTPVWEAVANANNMAEAAKLLREMEPGIRQVEEEPFTKHFTRVNGKRIDFYVNYHGPVETDGRKLSDTYMIGDDARMKRHGRFGR